MINKVILVGNVGVDPEVRAMESGVKVARVRLATSERMYNRQTNETTEHIEGRLRTREWTDKDNNKRYTTEILADEMKLLGRRSDSAAGTGASQGQSYGQPSQQPSYSQQPYGQPQSPAYSQPQYAQPQAQPQPPAPAMPADDPDDLPF